MNIFQSIPEIRDEDLHTKFKLLRDSPFYKTGKSIIEGWVVDFHDRDNKIVKEFQTTFHSAFWEFYLHAVFKKLNFNIDSSHNRPDYIIKSPKEIYVEAVVSEIKVQGVSEKYRTLEDNISNLRPFNDDKEFSLVINESIVRNSNSIISKHRKYTGYTQGEKYTNGYKDCSWVDLKNPFLIALSSYDQIQYGREYIYSMCALLYGYYFSPEQGIYAKRESIKKPGTDSDIKLGLFNDADLKEISAIIFCNTLTLGKISSLANSSGLNSDFIINIRYVFEAPNFRIHEVSPSSPEDILDGLYIFHNPHATNKIDDSFFNSFGITQFSCDEAGFYQIGGRSPIVARYHSNLPAPGIGRELIKTSAASNYNNKPFTDCFTTKTDEERTVKKSKNSAVSKRKKRLKKIANASKRKNRN